MNATPRRDVPLGDELFRAIFARSLDAIFLVDDDGVYLDANPAACELVGVPREAIVGRTTEHFLPPDYDVVTLRRRFHAVGTLRGTYPMRRVDGTYRDVEYAATASVLPGVHLASMRDVTERRHAEALRGRLAAIVESTDDAVLAYDRDGAITTWNRGARLLFGYEPSEIVGQPVATLGTTAASGPVVERYETTRVRRDGTHVEVAVTRSPILDAQGAVIGTSEIARDLTAQRKSEQALRSAEEQLRHAQKMEAIGSLAGGVAHDFNNLLSIVLSYSEIVASDESLSAAARGDLEHIKNAGLRAADLTRQLLAFSRKQILVPKVIDLAGAALALEGLLRRLIGEDIELVIAKHDDGVHLVEADPGQIDQVIMNLVVNARDAMPAGGTLTISTGVSPDGSCIRLCVSDTGEGMDETTRRRIFEPFFTTKEVGKGTGLGLSTVVGIVEQSGGHIEVRSAPGAGATFEIDLPRILAGGGGGEIAPPSASDLDALRGGETILLAEDDASVRALAQSILERHGYRVLGAASGEDALGIARAYEGSIDLLLTDVIMPRMSGRQLADRLVLERPTVQVVYMSGYTDRAIVREGVLDEGIAFVPKPLTPRMLLQKVRDVLNRVLLAAHV
jgi:two-component system, cell cycle sensor histidine kinase and response regulator CckA